MQITVDIDEETFNALNNACIAYNDVIFGIVMGCEVPSVFEPLREKSEEELWGRLNKLKQLYLDIQQKTKF